ncbi:MAG: hypothetical protein MJZ87_08230, partial [Bacteroidales bacterium]|nr:hypothetical protein [Bacteroidales bacterium]
FFNFFLNSLIVSLKKFIFFIFTFIISIKNGVFRRFSSLNLGTNQAGFGVILKKAAKSIDF